MTAQQPTTEVIAVEVLDHITRTTIRRPALVPPPPVAPASLIDPQGYSFPLHRLSAGTADVLTFETDLDRAESKPPLQPGTACLLQSWWTPDQLQAAHSLPSQWSRAVFESSDAVSYPVEGGTLVRTASDTDQPSPEASLIAGGWDHEHCKLCWHSISDAPGEDPCGYTDGSSWLCVACYTEYIVSGFGATLG